MPVGLGKVENVLGFVPPVVNNELGWGGSGGGDESGEFHLFLVFGDLNLNLRNWARGFVLIGRRRQAGELRRPVLTLAE